MGHLIIYAIGLAMSLAGATLGIALLVRIVVFGSKRREAERAEERNAFHAAGARFKDNEWRAAICSAAATAGLSFEELLVRSEPIAVVLTDFVARANEAGRAEATTAFAASVMSAEAAIQHGRAAALADVAAYVKSQE